MQTGKQIMKDVLAHKPMDKAAHWLMGLEHSDFELAKKLDTHYGSNSWRRQLHSCIHGGHIGFIKDEPQNGVVRDTFGVPLQVGSISHTLDILVKTPDISGFAWPNPEDMLDWDDLCKQMDARPDDFQLWGLAMGLFERGWYLRGTENLLVDMIEEEEFVEELLDGIMNVHLAFIDMLCERTNVDAIYGGDDVCDQRGVIMGLERWRQFFKPRQKQLIERAHSHGIPYIMHSCGNVLPLIDDLIEIGLDGLESLQPEAVDLATLKQKAKGKLALIGGMGVQKMLFSGTPEEIRTETHRLKAMMGEGGGYVLAPSKGLWDEPTENAAAFIDAIIEEI